MPDKKQPHKHPKVNTGKEEIIKPPVDPEEPLNIPENDPDIIPDEDMPEPLPYEKPLPGEGP